VILRPSCRSGVAMPRPARSRALFASCLAVCVAACAATPATVPPAAVASVVEGRIVSIDPQPWTSDGNAVIRIDSVDRGSVAVALPARSILCQAAPVDVEALAIGMRVRAEGSADGEGGLVVCHDATHRLVQLD